MYMLMGTDNNGALQGESANRRLRRTDGVVLEEVGCLENQEEPKFQFKSKGRKKPMSQIQGTQAEGILSSLKRVNILFYSVLQLIG